MSPIQKRGVTKGLDIILDEDEEPDDTEQSQSESMCFLRKPDSSVHSSIDFNNESRKRGHGANLNQVISLG